MAKQRIGLWVIAATLAASSAGMASGQTYPNKPVRIVASEAGGAGDFVARVIAQGIAGPLGQSVVVENRPLIIDPLIVLKALPDGYTLLLGGTALWIQPLLEKMPYDAVKDFLPISILTISPHVLIVHPSVPVKSVRELIDLAKSKPGALNYASNPIGSSPHLAAELFKSMAGVNFVRIAYKGSAPSLNALLGGEVQLTFVTSGTVAPHLKSDRLRALAVTTLQPTTLFPGMPTVAASLPGYEAVSMLGMFAPAKTPAAIISRLSQEIGRVLRQTEVKEKFSNAGVEAIGSSPEELAAKIKSEGTRTAKLIKDAGIRAE